MRIVIVISLLVILAFPPPAVEAQRRSERTAVLSPVLDKLELPSYAFVNGKWFDGQFFNPRTVYSVDGTLTFQKPKRIDKTLDLKGTYVIPPFGEAHNHNLTSQYLADAMIPKYLKEGVFYAKMQSSLPYFTGQILHRFNRADSVDAIFADGPLTATGGHPVALRERLLESGIYPGFKRDS